MASISISVPDAQVDRVAAAYGWPQIALEGETKAQFMKRQIALAIKARVFDFETDTIRGAGMAALPQPPVLDAT
jgi:hypothetical protein